MQESSTANRILNMPFTYCGELLTPIAPSIKITALGIGKRFQFGGDKDRVREVVDFEGEIVLVKTL